MGNLIKVLGKDLENCPHFFLDFESKCFTGVRCVFLCVCVVGDGCRIRVGVWTAGANPSPV